MFITIALIMFVTWAITKNMVTESYQAQIEKYESKITCIRNLEKSPFSQLSPHFDEGYYLKDHVKGCISE